MKNNSVLRKVSGIRKIVIFVPELSECASRPDEKVNCGMRIKNVVFDFGGVLLDWNPRYLYRNYFKTEKEMEYFLSCICTDEWNAEQDRGRPFDEGVRLLVERYPDYAEAIRMYRDEWPAMLRSDIPETVDLLYRLKAAGYGIYGLTNWSAETIPVAFDRYSFLHDFDGIVVSGREGLLKPDPRIYALLLERYGLKAEESVFLDDNLRNVEAAREAGWHAFQFRDARLAEEELFRLFGESVSVA